MKVIQVHNCYRQHGGVETVLDQTSSALRLAGCQVIEVTASSREATGLWLNRVRAFASGLYSSCSYRRVLDIINREMPDVVHIHNLYPLLSHSVVLACASAGVPTVLSCHNYRLFCPIGRLMCHGIPCDRCASGQEYWCVLKNCRGNVLESTAYALHNFSARAAGVFPHGFNRYVAPSEFVGQRLVRLGIDPARLSVIAHMVEMPRECSDARSGGYVGYVGRITEDKGVRDLIAAATQLRIPLHIAGTGEDVTDMAKSAGPDIRFVGHLDRQQLGRFYSGARFIVMPSKCIETFGLAAAEAMAHGRPVVASSMGALPEIVVDGQTGFLFPAGDGLALKALLHRLWGDTGLCSTMGSAARERAFHEYHPDRYVDRLLHAYRTTISTSQ